MHARKRWTDVPGTNLLDGGRTSIALTNARTASASRSDRSSCNSTRNCERSAGLGEEAFDHQMDRTRWPELRQKLAAVFKTRTRDEWMEIFDNTDACVAPVIGLFEAPSHPHLAARETFIEVDGYVQPAPAPRFSHTVSAIQGSARAAPVPVSDVLGSWSNVSPSETLETREGSVASPMNRG
jgi:alpha-methylacyl-CoA racemase